jgi:hypothetical protein
MLTGFTFVTKAPSAMLSAALCVLLRIAKMVENAARL